MQVDREGEQECWFGGGCLELSKLWVLERLLFEWGKSSHPSLRRLTRIKIGLMMMK